MTAKGLSVLHALMDAVGTEPLAAVVVHRDVGVEHDHSQEIARVVAKAGIALRTPEEPLPAHSFSVAVGWRFMIRDERRLLVLHDSLLPRYRGFAPLVSALINGERELGVTALWASDRYDCGPIVDQAAIAISYPLTIQEAIDAVIPLYRRLATTIVARLLAGERVCGREQDESDATYSPWRDDYDYLVDWNEDAATVARFVDAVGPPYGGARAYCGGREIRIPRAAVERDGVALEARHAGKVFAIVDGAPSVVCGEGLVRLLAVSDASTGASLLPWKELRARFSAERPGRAPTRGSSSSARPPRSR
jgi:methionyl-tRNA formyltransferase